MSKDMKRFDALFDLNSNYQFHPIEVPDLIKYLDKKKGWVYVDHSPINNINGVAKYLKIGRTAVGPMERAKSLSQTGVAYDYSTLFSLVFMNSYIAEKNIFKKLSKFRGEKEFFHVNLDMAVDCIEEEYQRQKKALMRYVHYESIREDHSILEHYLL